MERRASSKDMDQEAKLRQAVGSTEAVQKAARDLMTAQATFADSFAAWAEDETDSAVRQTMASAMPLFDELSSAQCEYIALLRSFVYYEMGQLQDLVAARKAATKYREASVSQLTKKKVALDRATSTDKNVLKAQESFDESFEIVKSARKLEARSKISLDYLKTRLFKRGFSLVAKASEDLSAKSQIIWKGIKEATDAMPEPEMMDSAEASPDDVDVAETSSILQAAKDELQQVADFNPRYPGVFLHKKPEKVGRTQKRFFQLESSEDGDSNSCRLCYYTEARQGVAVDLKGSVILKPSTTIDLKVDVGVILITTDSRTWVLSAKNDMEAKWWKRLFENAKNGLVTGRIYCPLDLPEPDSNTIDAVMALTEEEVTALVESASIVSIARTTDEADDDGLVASAVKNASVVGNQDDEPLPTLPGDASCLSAMHEVVQDYKCEEGEGTLDVKTGDVVKIDEKGSEGWWYAVLREGNEGWMPASMCSETPQGQGTQSKESAAPAPTAASATTTPAPAETTTPAPAKRTPAPIAAGPGPDAGTSSDGGASALASADNMYKIVEAYKSEEGEGTLDLKPGDVMAISEKGDGWWYATLASGDAGWVPETLLEPLGSTVGDAVAQSPNAIVVRALYDSAVQNDDELAFKEGDLIIQLQGEDDQGWCTGRIQGTDKEGLYPANYVEAASSEA